MRLLVAYRRATAPRLSRVGRLAVAWLASLSLAVLQVVPVAAEVQGQTPAPAVTGPLLLEADQLEYDFEHKIVTARGNVQIYYGAYVLDAAKVTYNQSTKRLIASGGVRMLEPGGNVLTADALDITDDFRDGFVDSLNVITPDSARFSARKAERRDGELTIFYDGAYTACAPCLEHPERPPLWQIKATRIIHKSAEKTVYYRNARLEFIGIPVAYMPVFFHPDPTVKRKTGLFVPSLLQGDAIGVGVTTPFFWNLAPNYDVTLSPTFLTRQGLLAQAQWRHRLMKGSYTIRLAGIFQRDPGAFTDGTTPLSGDRKFRGSLRTTGDFSLSRNWTFGWDIHATTDATFNRDYSIAGADEADLASTAYLTGMSETNYFDVRGYHFLVQRENSTEDLPDDGNPATPISTRTTTRRNRRSCTRSSTTTTSSGSRSWAGSFGSIPTSPA